MTPRHVGRFGTEMHEPVRHLPSRSTLAVTLPYFLTVSYERDEILPISTRLLSDDTQTDLVIRVTRLRSPRLIAARWCRNGACILLREVKSKVKTGD